MPISVIGLLGVSLVGLVVEVLQEQIRIPGHQWLSINTDKKATLKVFFAKKCRNPIA